MTHKELVGIAHRWATKNVSCGVVLAELYNSLGECPDVIGFGGWHSVLIECKASRSDFLADRNKSWRQEEAKGMGTYRYYCCPEGLIQLADLPPKWGLLWVTPKGKVKRVFDPFNEAYHYNNPYKFERNIEAEQQYLYCILRRINIRGGLHLAYSQKQQLLVNEPTPV